MGSTLDIDDLYDVEVPSQPALSNDGSRAVYVVRTVNREEDRDEHRLWILDLKTGEYHVLTDGPADRCPVWSPDGTHVAFFRDDGDCSRLIVLDLENPDDTRALAELAPGASNLRWSPDGSQLAFLSEADIAEQLGLESTVGTLAPVVVTKLGYKADGRGLFGTARRQPHTVTLAGGIPQVLVSNDWNFSSLEWHPDSTAVLVIAQGEPDSDILGTSSVYELALTETSRPAIPRLVALGEGYAVHAQWLLDASALLVVGRDRPDLGHMHLLLVGLDGTVRCNLSSAADRNVSVGDTAYAGMIPQQLSDGSIHFVAYEGGSPVLYRTGVDERHPVLVRGNSEESYSQLSIGETQSVGIRRSAQSFGEITTLTHDGDAHAVTDHGNTFWRDRNTIVPIAREFTLTSGERVPGWVIRDTASATPGPLLLDIHGGPHNAWNPLADDAHWYHQVLAMRGWTVLLLNPSASDGYGEEFYLANIGSWGHGDEDAFFEPVDTLVAEGIADERRIVVTGYSYGGYSVCWLTTRTDRFAAAIAGGVVSDVMSLSSSDVGFPELFKDLGATPWESPNKLAAQSPFAFVDQVSTPTLLLHGTGEDRCPVNQAEQWFTALRAQGVTTQLVLYPEASHLMILNGRPSHRADYQRRVIDWATRFTSPIPAP